MYNKLFLLSLFLFLNTMAFAGNLKGKITDENGDPLEFANVYIRNGVRGTTTNAEGNYSLALPAGQYEVVFRYIGYVQKIQNVTIGSEDVVLDMQLQPEAVEMKEFEVSADAEDPAYRVIREAIKKRPFYQDQVKSYSCNAYVKGNNRLLDAPKMMMGQEVGDLGGSLDTNRQGIIYLSEAVTKYHVRRPNQVREEMISSKVSGRDNGVSFNNAQQMDFTFYDNQLEIGRPLISPIADGAMLFYKYKLEGTFYDENKQMVNKIRVIPKREYDPIFSGYIYIIEDKWSIYSTDLMATKEATKVDFLDSLVFRQNYRDVTKEVSMPFSRNIAFQGKVLGFHFRGDYVAVYTDYELDPTFPKGFFSNEVLSVNDDVNKKTDEYWQQTRPVPLTKEEQVDYVVKDSLQEVHKSKKYLDSLDRESNKFKPLDLFSGYSYNKRYKKLEFTVASPINTISFNTVQGWNFGLNATLRKDYGDYRTRWFSVSGGAGYGLSDKTIRWNAGFTYHFNSKNFAQLDVSGGNQLTQFNGEEPIGAIVNAIYSTFCRQNFMKVYDRTFAKISWQQELVNGIYGVVGVEYARRKLVENTSDFTWNKKSDNLYTSNIPAALYEGSGWEGYTNNALIVNAAFRFRINQKYMTYPHRKIILGSKWPELWIRGRFGVPALGSDVNFVHLSAELKYEWSMGLFGNSEVRGQGGFFPVKKAIQPMDFKHFNGNLTVLAKADSYMTGFQLMPYYLYSTTEPYVQAHYQHNFNGFIFNKIPLIKKLGFTEVAGYHIMYAKGMDPYMELNFGIDKLGWKVFRLLRVDWNLGFAPGEGLRQGFTVSLKI